MQTIELEFKDESYEDTLMSHLRDQVFHITTEKAFKSIIKDSYIFHNKSDQFPLNTSSENSLGRNNGWVCLFDFCKTSEAEIQNTKSCYNFLGPSWFWEYFKKHRKLSIAYLILTPSCYDKIISNNAAKGIYKQYIPGTECWFPGDIPLEYVDKAIALKVHESAPVHNPHLYALHLIGYENKKTRSHLSLRKGISFND